jgi:hypothetical protein
MLRILDGIGDRYRSGEIDVGVHNSNYSNKPLNINYLSNGHAKRGQLCGQHWVALSRAFKFNAKNGHSFLNRKAGNSMASSSQATLPSNESAGADNAVQSLPPEAFIPSVLRPYLALPVQQIPLLELSGRIKRQYQMEVEYEDGVEARVAACAKVPIFAIKNHQKSETDPCDYKIIDGGKRWRAALKTYMQLECHCKPFTLAARVLDLTVVQAEKLMDKADQEENVLKVFGLSAVSKSEDSSLDEFDHYATHFAKRSATGRIGRRFDAELLDELLGDSETDWSDEELYNADEVWDVMQGLQWWLEAVYFAFSTEAAMARLAVKEREIHPLQKALLAESREVFELSTAACEEQIRSGYILCRNGASEEYDYDSDFPDTVALMRAYRTFTLHVADAICAIFPKIDRQKLSLIV